MKKKLEIWKRYWKIEEKNRNLEKKFVNLVRIRKFGRNWKFEKHLDIWKKFGKLKKWKKSGKDFEIWKIS